MSDAKVEILSRIRKAGVIESEPATSGGAVSAPRSHREIVEQFAEYAAEYRANVIRVKASELTVAIGNALADRDSRRVVVAKDFSKDRLPEGIEIVEDDALDNLVLDGIAAVVTDCAIAIAETGTVVLDAGLGQGRRAISLIPDHHVCIVREDQVVDSVPEAVEALHASVLQGQPLTWISGPSATSDIELSRVEGVHGPRHLDIILMSD